MNYSTLNAQFRKYYKRQNGHTLLGIMIALTINIILLTGVLHFVFIVAKSYNKLQQRFDYQNSQLIAKHYLSTDIRNSNMVANCKAINGSCSGIMPNSLENLIKKADIKAASDILILNNAVAYYIRKSIIPNNNHAQSYTLYRDPFYGTAIALVEGITDFEVRLSRSVAQRTGVFITLFFKQGPKMEVVFVPRVQ